jgi:pantoate--beta-alanine ligase
MKVVRGTTQLRLALRDCRRGLVPTMGAFHDGHLSLMRAARTECEQVVVSLFVNPTQFGISDDLVRYPRDEERDVRLAEQEGVDVLFIPSNDEMYPAGFSTWVDIDVSGGEASARPGHFRGVATVCVKLFNIVRPQRAYFGQKDAQQVAVIRRVVRDLNLPLEIRVVETVRDEDGLAFSSRNVRLSPDERVRALALPRALAAGREAYTHGADAISVTCSSFNGLQPEYVELVELGEATLLAAALRVGDIRLIDNVLLKGELS